jgi:hypothetical protein
VLRVWDSAQMAHGADINATNAHGETLLQVIVSNEPSYRQLTSQEWVTALIASTFPALARVCSLMSGSHQATKHRGRRPQAVSGDL